MKEIVIGFDVREMKTPYLAQWSDERKQTYLIKKQVKKPLSIDRLVWPSVLDDAPNGTVNNICLWRNGNVLKQFFQAMAQGSNEAFCVAFTLLSDDRTSLENFDLAGISPAEIGQDWELLGYDVADGGLLSGLTNCGYEPTDAHHFAGLFIRHINKYHLFTDFGVASVFAEMNDLRVPEHAPFFVYGIYRI